MVKQSHFIGAIVAVIAVLLAGFYFIAGSAGGLNIGEQDTPPFVETGVQCDSTTTPNLTIKSYDVENVGTALTEATNLYRMKGNLGWSTFTAGTGFDVAFGEDYEVIMGISTSDFTDNAYGQYFMTGPVPCKETPIIEKAVANDEVETSLSATFYNADGDASAETFSAGQSQTISLKLAAGTDEYFGNPFIAESGISGPQRAAYPNVVCVDLNSTAWDKPEKVTFDGEEMRSVSVPQRHTGSATAIAYCYEAPVIDDSLMEGNRYLIRLNADDSNAPAVDDTAYIYAANFYIDGDTGEVAWGVENEEGTAVGTDASDSVTLDFTA